MMAVTFVPYRTCGPSDQTSVQKPVENHSHASVELDREKKLKRKTRKSFSTCKL